MLKTQILRGFINQRLSVAAEEIFELFERTIAEYEEQLCRKKEENERQKKLLEAVYNPEVRLHRAGVQQRFESTGAAPSKQQERNPTPDQQIPPEPPHIKEEQGEPWSSREGEQLHGPEEADTSRLVFTPVSVKNEIPDEEKPQTSQFHENLTEGMRKAEVLKTEPDFDPDCLFRPAADFDYAWEDSCEPQSGLDSAGFDPKDQAQDGKQILKAVKPFSCSVCGTRWRNKKYLTAHMMCHTKSGFSCSVCNKTFLWRGELASHMRIHTEEKPFSSSVTDSRLSNLTSPIDGDTEEKRFTCPVCEKSFTNRTNLLDHMRIHAGEKCSCSICGKRLYKYSLGRHMKTHTDEPLQKPFSCAVCGKSFTHNGNLKRHMTVHTGEKPFSCSVCGKSFAQNGNLKQHMTVHTGEKLFGCSVCGRSFTQSGTLKRHLTLHSREEQYRCHVCQVCHRSFTKLSSLQRHKCELSFLL